MKSKYFRFSIFYYSCTGFVSVVLGSRPELYHNQLENGSKLDRKSLLAVIYTVVLLAVALYFYFSKQATPSIRPTTLRTSRQFDLPQHLRDSSSKIEQTLKSAHPHPIVSITLNDVVISIAFENDKQGTKMIINRKNLGALQRIAAVSELYAILQVENDEEEIEATHLLSKEGVFNYFKKQRLLFHSKTSGRVAIVRQLHPSTHIEVNDTVIRELNGKVPNIVQVSIDRNSVERQVYAQSLETIAGFLEQVHTSQNN